MLEAGGRLRVWSDPALDRQSARMHRCPWPDQLHQLAAARKATGGCA